MTMTMKSTVFVLSFVSLLFLLLYLGGQQPAPKHPITITSVPLSTTTVTGKWKMGVFVTGYRIETDEYVVISGFDGLAGQQGAFGGPGLVHHNTVRTFGRVVEIAEEAKNTRPITFYGDVLYTRGDREPYLFEGKKVILLFSAIDGGKHYVVSRRPLFD